MSDNDLSNTLKKFGSAPLPTGGLPQTATLRDQFAMAALTAVMDKVGGFDPKMHASDAYEIADAMMEARK